MCRRPELGRQCAKMLAHGVIHPRSSGFSTPVLLFKRSGNFCSFCVDYRALNVKTTKDKFSIPIVEDLLNELRVVFFFSKLDYALTITRC
jgi:hypothetical protein